MAELLAPGRIAALIGIEDDDEARMMLRGFGVREIGTGIGLLTVQQPGGWMWGRVAGDLLDLSAMGAAFASPATDRKRLAAATAAVAGVTALDLACSLQLSRNGDHAESTAVLVRKATTVNRPVGEVYRFWRDFENLPRFMHHLESVQTTGEGHSRWTAKAPAGRTVEWEARITEDTPDEVIAWESLPESDVQSRGMVQFQPAPGDRGTEVLVAFEYEPPAGRLGAAVAKLFGEEPGQQVQEDLRRFKQMMEIGELVSSDASIHSGMHPARPADTRSDQ
jgi:uncharacterized membrane protein